MSKPSVLIVEDDDLQFEIYEDALTSYQLMRVADGTTALAAIRKQPPDLLILVSAIVVIVLFISGLFYFRHMERTFADTI